MPQSVTLFCPRGWSLDTVAQALDVSWGAGTVRVVVLPTQVQIHVGSECVARIDGPHDGRLAADDYGSRDDVDPRFRATIRTLSPIDLHFRDFEAAREVLRRVLRFADQKGDELWVDSDYGWVLDGRSFLRHISDDVPADWRTDEPWQPEDGN